MRHKNRSERVRRDGQLSEAQLFPSLCPPLELLSCDTLVSSVCLVSVLEGSLWQEGVDCYPEQTDFTTMFSSYAVGRFLHRNDA